MPIWLIRFYLNVYELKTPYNPEKVLWGTYKGDNTRDGLVFKPESDVTSLNPSLQDTSPLFSIHPNPVSDRLMIKLGKATTRPLRWHLLNAQGQVLEQMVHNEPFSEGEVLGISTSHLPAGLYGITIWLEDRWAPAQKFLKLN